MTRSTGIVIGISALVGLVAAWATVSNFDPSQGGKRLGADPGAAPRPSSRDLADIWMTGDMGELFRRAGLWSVADPGAVWPRYYRACAVDRLGQDSTHAWQRVLDAADRRMESNAQVAVGGADNEFWVQYHRGLALVRLARADEGEPVLAAAMTLLDLDSNRSSPVQTLYLRANVEAVLGRPDAAVDLLERSADESNDNRPYWLAWAVHDPELAGIADHPRFLDLIRRLEDAQNPD